MAEDRPARDRSKLLTALALNLIGLPAMVAAQEAAGDAVVRGLNIYGSYAEANRAPTPAELSCANAAAPCSLLQEDQHGWRPSFEGFARLEVSDRRCGEPTVTARLRDPRVRLLGRALGLPRRFRSGLLESGHDRARLSRRREPDALDAPI